VGQETTLFFGFWLHVQAMEWWCGEKTWNERLCDGRKTRGVTAVTLELDSDRRPRSRV
jgi:hypothetical protein